MDCGRAVSMARMLAVRRAFGDAARGNRLNLDGEHGHGGERYGESEFLHVNLRSSATDMAGIRHGGLGLYSNRRTPDGSVQCTGRAAAGRRGQVNAFFGLTDGKALAGGMMD
jgi:hypothetical protein